MRSGLQQKTLPSQPHPKNPPFPRKNRFPRPAYFLQPSADMQRSRIADLTGNRDIALPFLACDLQKQQGGAESIGMAAVCLLNKIPDHADLLSQLRMQVQVAVANHAGS